MPEFVSGIRSIYGQRIAALSRALIVTDVQRVRSSLLILVIILQVPLQTLILRRRYWGLQQNGSFVLPVLDAVIALGAEIRVVLLGSLPISLVAVNRGGRALLLRWQGTRRTCEYVSKLVYRKYLGF